MSKSPEIEEAEVTRVSTREAISQLQKTLRASVYRWKFKALNDWHSKLIVAFPLTKGVIDDIVRRLHQKYPLAERNFNPNELQVSEMDLVSLANNSCSLAYNIRSYVPSLSIWICHQNGLVYMYIIVPYFIHNYVNT